MVAQYPCRACSKNVNINQKAIFCNSCNLWIHSKCNNLTKHDFDRLSKENDDIPFICKCCISDNIPFSNLSNKHFNITVTKGVNYMFDDNDNDLLTLNEQQLNLINNFQSVLHENSNPTLDENDVDALQPPICSYFSINEFCSANFDPNKNFSILHLNVHSIQLHIEEVRTMLLLLNFHFDFLAFTESKLMKGSIPITNIEIEGYNSPYSCPSEASKGGVLLYTSNKFNIIPRPDLQTYSPKEVESIFVEVVNQKAKNDIIGVIYRHHTIEKVDFNKNHIHPLLEKLSKESNKNLFIAGDFNINLLKTNTDADALDFFDLMSNNMLLPAISLPTRISSGTETLIDNIFTNIINSDAVSGNLTIGISDHLPSFLIIPKKSSNHIPKKHNLFKRDIKNLNREALNNDLAQID